MTRELPVGFFMKDEKRSVVKIYHQSEDKGIRSNWGDIIYRINLTSTAPKKNDQHRFEITAVKSKT